jgi:hypothetical protein
VAGYSDFFRRRSSQAQSFLSSGSVNYNPLPVVGSNRTGCFDSSGCASGWACVGGICVEEGSASQSGSGNTSGCGGGGADGSLPGECGAGNTTYLRLDKDLAEVYQKALNNLRPGDVLLRTALGGGTIGNGLIGLSLNGKCLKTGCSGTATTLGTNDACCGAGRCCRYSGFGVQCYCGGCPPPIETCSKFCTAYQASNGFAAAGCTPENTCDECESCGDSGCVPKTSGPCWCESGNCGRCEACTESGTCVDDSANCARPSPDPDPDPDPSPVDPCAGTCSTITVCGDQPDPVCPSKNSCRQSGDITVGSQNCRLFEQCDKSDVPAECGFCDCNCDNDCPDCQVCNSSGVCVPDPSCDNTVAGVPIQCGGSYCGGVAYTGTGCEVNPTSHVQTPGSDPCDPVSGFGYFKEGTLTIEKVRQVPLPNGSFTYEWRVAGQKYNPLGGGSFAYSSVKPLGLESPVVTGNADIVTGVGGGNCAPDCGGGSDPDPGEGNCDEGYSACGDLETCCPPGTGCQEYGTSTLSNGGEYPTSGSAVIRYDQRTLSCNGTQGGPGVYPREMASIMNYSGGSGVIHIAQDNAGPACGSGGNSTVTLSGYVRNGYSCV